MFDFYVNGQLSFYGTGGGGFSQNDRADFLMGLPDELYQAPAAPSNIRTHNIGWFFQDEWKVRRNFRLTLGIRYEYSSPKLDLQGRTFTAVLGQKSSVFTNAPTGLLFPGDAAAPSGANYPDRNDWAPRLGFAWDPKGDGKMSIRGGFGIFYDILKAEDNFQFNGQPPFFRSADLFFDPLSKNPAGEINFMTQPFVATGRRREPPIRSPPGRPRKTWRFRPSAERASTSSIRTSVRRTFISTTSACSGNWRGIRWSRSTTSAAIRTS